MIFRKLLVIIMGIFLIICGGAANIYPLYFKQMRDQFGFSLKEVNLYGTFINMGVWIAFPMGWIYDKFGPKISCVLGASLLSGTYLSLHFLFNSNLTSISIVLFLFIALLMGQGAALCYTTSVTTNLKNFRFKESSAVVGLLVANFALSPSVFTTYRQAMHEVSTNKYFLTISIFILCVISACFIVFHNIRRLYNTDEDKQTYEKYKEKQIIKLLIYLNIFILIIYTFGVIFHSIWESDQVTSKFPLIIIYPSLQLLNFVVIILEKFKVFDNMYFKPYMEKLVVKQMKIANEGGTKDKLEGDNTNELVQYNGNSESRDSYISSDKEFTEVRLGTENDKKEVILNNHNQNSNYTNNNSNSISREISNENTKSSVELGITISDNVNISFKDAILSKQLLMLFVLLTLGVGSQISNLNNIEFIILAANKNSSEQKLNIAEKANTIYSYVILYFVFNSFTRIISGLLLDHLIRVNKLFYYLIIITVFGLISQLLGIFMNKTLLVITVSLGGACTGGYMTFMPVFVRNEYGLTHMGKILGFLTSGNALGSLLIADLLFILPYNLNLDANGECYGKKCFMPSYVLTSIFFCINLTFSFLLFKDHKQKLLNKEGKELEMQTTMTNTTDIKLQEETKL